MSAPTGSRETLAAALYAYTTDTLDPARGRLSPPWAELADTNPTRLWWLGAADAGLAVMGDGLNPSIPHDRILVNGDILDEIVATDVTFHFEAMGWHGWWGCITDKSGKRLDFWMRDFRITEDFDWPIAAKDGGELLYVCKTRWEDRHGVLHQCEIEVEHKRHRCECGARKAADAPGACEDAAQSAASPGVGGNATDVVPGRQIGNEDA